MEQELKAMLLANGVGDVGFAMPADAPQGLAHSISLAVGLSSAIVDEIGRGPTHTYFHHYRTVNAFLDGMALRAGLLLAQRGWRYLTVGASQSINLPGKHYEGRYSHKKAAYLAGMGQVGRNNLFIHRRYGPRVRLATLFTDCPLPCPGEPAQPVDFCEGCLACVKACPAQALTGAALPQGSPRELRFDPAACSHYMKEHFRHIGRGAVCGICMKVCPQGIQSKGGEGS